MSSRWSLLKIQEELRPVGRGKARDRRLTSAFGAEIRPLNLLESRKDDFDRELVHGYGVPSRGIVGSEVVDGSLAARGLERRGQPLDVVVADGRSLRPSVRVHTGLTRTAASISHSPSPMNPHDLTARASESSPPADAIALYPR